MKSNKTTGVGKGSGNKTPGEDGGATIKGSDLVLKQYQIDTKIIESDGQQRMGRRFNTKHG